jgi:hypothetical protein
MRDEASYMQVKRVISPAVVTDNTAIVGQVIDRQGYDALTYIIATGTLADDDATFTVLLEESDQSGSGFAAVDDKDMISQSAGSAPEAAASFGAADDHEVRKIGYIGNKRYTRLTITPANNTGNAPIAAVAVLARAEQKPVTQAAA